MLLRCIKALFTACQAHILALLTIVKALAEKASNSMKEVVKVISELATKLDTFAVDIKVPIGKTEESTSEMKAEVGKLCESVQFMSTAFEEFKNDVQQFRRELAEVKGHNQEFAKQNREMSRQLADEKGR